MMSARSKQPNASGTAARFASRGVKVMIEDAEIVRQLARGDANALKVLYDRYSTNVFALLARMLGSGAEAEEQLQEVFLVLWREASRYDASRGSLRAWLYTMARRRALDVIRARGSRPQLGAEEDAALTQRGEHSDETPEGSASAHQRAAAVTIALAALPPKQREVLDLAYFQGLSQYEIAARLGVPVGTIKSRVRDAMIRLRAPLASHQS
jgi:RNA polymerase sigma-70 factor (ECF subfamily)